MSDEVQGERFCPTEGCGKKLRRDNTKGICGGCQSGHKKHLAGAAVDPAKPRKPRAAKEVDASGAVARLRVVAEAVGLDADQVLDELAAGWLASLKERFAA